MEAIRKYEAGDLGAVYRICLETGAHGQDATTLYQDRNIVGHVYAGPHVTFAPESAFVVEDDGGVGGYIIGPKDTTLFEERLEREWWPKLRREHPRPANKRYQDWSADERMAFLIHRPQRTPGRIASHYPAHLHVDLLPRFQGRGIGKRMLDTWIGHMRQQGARGFHLGVSTQNARAIRFYRAYGLGEIEAVGSPPTALVFGQKLNGS